MATTTGFVHRLTLLSAELACAWVGPETASAEALTIQFSATDTANTTAFKQSLVGLLLEAQLAGREVDAGHGDSSAEITSVLTKQANTTTTPLQVDAIEITQTVQDLAHSIPLLAGKRTVVRIYLSYHTTPGITVRGAISVRRSPTAAPLIILSDNVVVLDPTQAGNIPVKRENATRSLNFVLPSSHITEGALNIRISSITNVVSSAALSVGNQSRPTIRFHQTPAMRVRVIGMRYTQGSPAVTYAPTTLDYNLLFSWLRRAYPVAQVIGSSVTVNATAAVPFSSGDINAQLAAIRALDMDAGGDSRTHYYGFVSDGGFFMRGSASGIPDTPNPATVASGPTGPGTWGWDTDGSFGDWYGGHELGHTYGRRHPGFCGETESDLANYPFANGQLANTASSFTGFDVGDPALGLPMRALPGMQWHDVMTYCNFQWSSAYTYLGIRRRLVAENPAAAAGSATLVAQLASGGRPDNRFPHSRISEPQLPGSDDDNNMINEAIINVVAQVNLTKKEGKIRFVNPLSKKVVSETDQLQDTAVMIRVRGADGQVLLNQPVAVQIDSELHDHDDQVGIVTAVLPVSTDARTIELVLDGQKVVDTIAVGGVEPSALPAAGANLAGNAAQSYFVQASTDNGQVWQTIAVGLQDPAFTLDQGQFPEGSEVLVRVVATNGLTNSVISQEQVSIKRS